MLSQHVSRWRMNSGSEEYSCVATYKPHPFVEVWSPDGSVRRFAAGTKAVFALERINAKIGGSNLRVVMIEAVKAGEQTVEFGPDADLVSYGKGWRLRAVPEQLQELRKHATKRHEISPIEKKRVFVVQRRNTVDWDKNNGIGRAESSKWNWPRDSQCGPSQKQRREQLFVGASFPERNSILRKIYVSSSYGPRRSSFGDPKS